jgi:hypothetical protein
MRYLKHLVICAVLFGCASRAPRKDVAEDPFLQPYLQQLKKSTSTDDLRRVAAMARSELILLLHGYGTGIRNRWIHGDRDAALVRFLRSNGVNDPEEMSMVIIEALWHDLNSSLSPAERAAVETRRATIARKRTIYEKLESDCEKQLAKARTEFERCYAKHGLPSKNPASHDPFFKLLVGKSGRVREIIFFEGAPPELKTCLANTINGFSFSAFSDDEFVTLYTLEFPRCRVAERDTMHD